MNNFIDEELIELGKFILNQTKDKNYLDDNYHKSYLDVNGNFSIEMTVPVNSIKVDIPQLMLADKLEKLYNL
jgi:hypothetical protein